MTDRLLYSDENKGAALNSKILIVHPYNSKNVLGKDFSQMALQRKYYNTIKFMVHMTDSRNKRKMMISQIARVNPYLCAQIIMTICEDTKEEEDFLIDYIESRLENATNNHKKSLLLIGLLELKQYDKFFEGYASSKDWIYDEKTRKFLRNNLSAKQQLILLEALLRNGENKYINEFVTSLKKKCSDENRLDVISFAKRIAGQGYIQCSYDLLNSVKLEHEMYAIFDENRSILENQISNKKSFQNPNECSLYLFYKFNIYSKTINDLELWDVFFDETGWIRHTESFRVLIKRYLKNGFLNDQTILYFLDRFGVRQESYNKEMAKSYLNNYLGTGTVYIEPYYSSMCFEDKMISLLDDPNFINKYEFSLERLGINTNFDVNQAKEYYLYFDKCFSNYKNVENIIRVYFNSPIKRFVNIEYLIVSISKRFNIDEKKMKYLLGDYVFKGKVCRINDNSVSIRAFNVWTVRSCRLNIRKYWVTDNNGQKHQLEIGDILFFKFAYITDEGKINVHYPELSYEKFGSIK